MSLNQLVDCTAKTQSPIRALKTFFNSVVIDSRRNAPSNMCMLVKTISELTDDNRELLFEAKRLLSAIEQSLQGVLDKAKECGELAEHEDTARLARYLQMQLMGLRTYSRTSDDELTVSSMIDDIFNNKTFLLKNH